MRERPQERGSIEALLAGVETTAGVEGLCRRMEEVVVRERQGDEAEEAARELAARLAPLVRHGRSGLSGLNLGRGWIVLRDDHANVLCVDEHGALFRRVTDADVGDVGMVVIGLGMLAAWAVAQLGVATPWILLGAAVGGVGGAALLFRRLLRRRPWVPEGELTGTAVANRLADILTSRVEDLRAEIAARERPRWRRALELQRTEEVEATEARMTTVEEGR